VGSNKILVIGDALEDVYYIAQSTRRSAEVDIPIYDVVNVKTFPGGAANIVRSLENLGFDCDFLYGLNSNLGVPQKCRIYSLALDGTRSESEQVARFDLNDKVGCVWSEFLDEKLTLPYKAVVVADYGKGSVNIDILDKLIVYCQKFHCPLFVHTKRNPASLWTHDSKLTTLFCNQTEYSRYAEQYNMFDLVVETKGPHGVDLNNKGLIVKSIPALAPRVVDVNGAGDVFMATYISRAVGTDLVPQHLPSALDYASVASAIAVQRPYTSYIEFQELKEGWYEYNNSKTKTS